MFSNKVLLITGGTGSFGNAVLDRFINSDLKEIEYLVVTNSSRIRCEINIKIQN